MAYDENREMLKASWLKPALKDLGFTVGRISEKRQLARVPGHHRRCFLKSFAGDTYSAGKLLNLSMGGAQVECDVEIPKGLKLVLKTYPIARLKDLVMEAEVKSCRRNAQTRKYHCGLRFLKGDEKLLKKHMSAMMQEC